MELALEKKKKEKSTASSAINNIFNEILKILIITRHSAGRAPPSPYNLFNLSRWQVYEQ